MIVRDPISAVMTSAPVSMLSRAVARTSHNGRLSIAAGSRPAAGEPVIRLRLSSQGVAAAQGVMRVEAESETGVS